MRNFFRVFDPTSKFPPIIWYSWHMNRFWKGGKGFEEWQVFPIFASYAGKSRDTIRGHRFCPFMFFLQIHHIAAHSCAAGWIVFLMVSVSSPKLCSRSFAHYILSGSQKIVFELFNFYAVSLKWLVRACCLKKAPRSGKPFAVASIFYIGSELAQICLTLVFLSKIGEQVSVVFKCEICAQSRLK